MNTCLGCGSRLLCGHRNAGERYAVDDDDDNVDYVQSNRYVD